MRRSKRHPVVESAVFAAALILAAFIGREFWKRRAPAAIEPLTPAVVVPAVLTPTFPPLPTGARRPRTESAVSAVPSLKLTRVRRRAREPVAVPAPK